MSTVTMPAAVAAVSRPEWATHDYGWDKDGDVGFTRTVYRPCGEVVKIMQGQTWDPVRGVVLHELEIVGMDSVMSLYSDERESAADSARTFAAELLEAARVWDEMRLS